MERLAVACLGENVDGAVPNVHTRIVGTWRETAEYGNEEEVKMKNGSVKRLKLKSRVICSAIRRNLRSILEGCACTREAASCCGGGDRGGRHLLGQFDNGLSGWFGMYRYRMGQRRHWLQV